MGGGNSGNEVDKYVYYVRNGGRGYVRVGGFCGREGRGEGGDMVLLGKEGEGEGERRKFYDGVMGMKEGGWIG